MAMVGGLGGIVTRWEKIARCLVGDIFRNDQVFPTGNVVFLPLAGSNFVSTGLMKVKNNAAYRPVPEGLIYPAHHWPPWRSPPRDASTPCLSHFPRIALNGDKLYGCSYIRHILPSASCSRFFQCI